MMNLIEFLISLIGNVIIYLIKFIFLPIVFLGAIEDKYKQENSYGSPQFNFPPSLILGVIVLQLTWIFLLIKLLVLIGFIS